MACPDMQTVDGFEYQLGKLVTAVELMRQCDVMMSTLFHRAKDTTHILFCLPFCIRMQPPRAFPADPVAHAAAYRRQVASSFIDAAASSSNFMLSPVGTMSPFHSQRLGHSERMLMVYCRCHRPSRIINVSSSAHTFGHIHFDNINLRSTYTPWGAYGVLPTCTPCWPP